MSNQLQQYILTNKQDAILYKAGYLVDAAGDDPYEVSVAVDDIKKMLSCIESEILLESYAKLCGNICKVKAATLIKIVKTEQDEVKKKHEVQQLGQGERGLPAWVNKDRLNEIGFDWKIDHQHTENTGMYFPYATGWLFQATNFIMTPIVQIISDDEMGRRRITEVFNGNKKHVFELPSSAFTSPDKLATLLMDQGYYLLKDGFGRPQLNKITSYFLAHYPVGYEITNLGWQEEGFFAFSNVVYHNGIKEFDAYGLAEVEGVKYLSMGSSNILGNLRKGTDIYKNDKHLRYDPAPISWKSWTKLMMEVYEDKAMMGIAWCLLAINRDIVSSLTSYCPIPYCYGAAQSGKSQFVASLVALFTRGLRPFNLNQGTEFAFWEYMGRFKNVLMAFNEFDVQSVDEKRVRAFKGVADVEGRNKGTGRRNKSETQEVHCLPVITGQYLATMDDNALLSRTTPEKFVENNDRPEEQIKAFEKLKTFEEAGITGLLINILEHRPYVNEHYLRVKSEVTHGLKADLLKDGFTPKNRVIENYTTMLTLMKIYNGDGRLEFAFTYDKFYAYCKNKILNLNTMIGESNTLGEFWKIIENLADRFDNTGIEPGWDYKIETVTEVKSMIAEKSSKSTVSFDKPTRLLFIRLKSVYGLFAKEKKNVSGKVAVGESTIKSYLEEQPYYIGASAAGNFKNKKSGITKNTSSMVINYDMLQGNEVNLREAEEPDDQRELTILKGKVQADARLQDNFGTVKVMFQLLQDEGYQEGDMRVDKLVYTKCLWTEKEKVRMLTGDSEVRVTGYLTIRRHEEKEYRTMEVTDVQMIRAIERAEEPAATPPAPEQMSLGGDFDPQYTQKPAF